MLVHGVGHPSPTELRLALGKLSEPSASANSATRRVERSIRNSTTYHLTPFGSMQGPYSRRSLVRVQPGAPNSRNISI
jgi:hypothetical protein